MHDYSTIDDFTSFRQVLERPEKRTNSIEHSARQLEEDVAKTISAMSEYVEDEAFVSKCLDDLLVYLEKEGLRIDLDSGVSQFDLRQLAQDFGDEPA